MMRGRVWHLGHDIDTDLLAPGHAMKFGIETIAKHCLENVVPEFATTVKRGDFIVAGRHFGIGSSREQAAQVLVHLGVAAVIAPSYGGLFFRNAFNVGLLLLTHADAGYLKEAKNLDFDLVTLTVKGDCGTQLACEPIPQFLIDMVQAGGLLPTLQMKRLRETSS
jgi:3-isopropylmalate/(R)-2-methylmalate dehydratase small subunit